MLLPALAAIAVPGAGKARKRDAQDAQDQVRSSCPSLFIVPLGAPSASVNR